MENVRDTEQKRDRNHDRHRDEDWRDLCAVATNEDDPIRLASLVSQILQVFEDRDKRSSLSNDASS